MPGAVTVAGRTLSTPETLVVSEHLQTGMVFQDIALLLHLAAGDNISCGERAGRRDAAG